MMTPFSDVQNTAVTPLTQVPRSACWQGVKLQALGPETQAAPKLESRPWNKSPVDGN